MQRLTLCFILCALLCSCNNKQRCDGSTTHISGEVANPTNSFVYLYKNEKQIDSILLDENNRFSITHDNLEKGLYSFKHNEYQTFYLTPGDSIVFRVNTIDFDESLHFSGSGHEKNNLLITLFLNNEKSTNVIKQFYTLPPEQYLTKLDSLNKINTTLIDEYLLTKEGEDATFEEIATANINFTKYLYKELYISNSIKNGNIPLLNDLPPAFFEHRNTVDYNNKNLQVYFPYYRYLDVYFDNVAFENYNKPTVFDRKHYEHCMHKIKAISSKLEQGQLRNLLLKNTASRYIINTKNEDKEFEVLTQFLATNTNADDHNEIKKLAEISRNHIPGKKIPNLQLVTSNNEMVSLHTLIKKPSVLYFWSYASIKSNKDLHIKARELANKYPEYDFIGINTDTDFRKWHKTILNFKYNTIKEFQLEDKLSSYQKLHINRDGKALIVHKDATIIEGNTYLNSFEIENELLGFLNL